MAFLDYTWLAFLLSLAARYVRNLLDSCGYVAGEISDARFEPGIQESLRPGWAMPAWSAAIILSGAFFVCIFVYDGYAEALGVFVAFALGYWVFDKWKYSVPACDAPHFIRLIYRSLVAKAQAEADSGRRDMLSSLVARMESRLGGKLT